MTREEICSLFKIVKDLGGSKKDLQRIIDDDEKRKRRLIGELAPLVGMFPSSEPKINRFRGIKVVDKNNIVVTVTVNYDSLAYQNLGQLWQMKDRKNLVAKRTGEQAVEIFLRRYDDKTKLDQIMSDFEASGLEPAAPEDLDYLGWTIGMLGSMVTLIVAFGAYWLNSSGERMVHCIDFFNCRFERGFFRYYDVWSYSWWFAARREESDLKFGPENQPKK